MVFFLPSSTLIWCNCCSCWPTQHHNLKNLEFVLCVFVYNILLGLIMNFTWEQSLRWFILTRRNLWWSRLIGLQIRCSKLYLLFLFFQRNDMCEEKEGENDDEEGKNYSGCHVYWVCCNCKGQDQGQDQGQEQSEEINRNQKDEWIHCEITYIVAH